MGMTREEATVVLGADVGTIERSLGVGKSYFDRWGKQLKSDQEKYTNWWGQELKRREEMEIASSVRSATRANAARKLLRERSSARDIAAGAEQSAANAVISAGSLPAGWAEQAALRKAGRELEMKAAYALKDAAAGAHGSAGAFRELMVVVREIGRGDMTRLPGSFSRLLGMIGLSIPAMLGVGAAMAAVGATIWQAKKMLDAEKEEVQSISHLNESREVITSRLIAELKNSEKAGRLTTDESTRMQDRLLYYNSPEVVRSAQQLLRSRGGTVTDKDLEEMQRLDDEHAKKMDDNHRQEIYAYQREQEDLHKIFALKAQMAGMEKTTIDYKKKQLELDELQRDLIKDQKDHEQDKLRIQKEQQVYSEAKLRAGEIIQHEMEKYMPTLEELGHRGIFRSQARQIGRLDRRAKREYEFGNVSAAKADVEARDRIYDSIAGRGVLPEREEKRQMDELNRTTAKHIADIAGGKKQIRVKAEIE